MLFSMLLVLLSAAALAQDNECGDQCYGNLTCGDFDGVYDRQFNWYPSDATEHGSGQHNGTFAANTTGSYAQIGGQLANGTYPCQVDANVGWGHQTWDSGLVDPIGTITQVHLRGDNELTFVSPGGYAPSQTVCGVWGFSVNSCSDDPEWPDPGCTYIAIGARAYCAISFATNDEGLYGVPVYETGASTGNVVYPYLTSTVYSPIVIDLNGGDFTDAFTDVDHGVTWDFAGRGHLLHMAWTNPKRNIGFLYLDRDDCPGCKLDGMVNNGRELFGNLTHQPLTPEQGQAELEREKTSPDPYPANGFLALGYFDRTENGGNNDGKIDKNDAVWPRLRVWVDTSQTADSRKGMVYTLDELGITAISLKYVPSSRTDQYGNQMRYEGSLTMGRTVATMPKIYDVFFKTIAQ